MVLFQDGKIEADSTTGRYLLDLVTGVPKIDPEAFEEMFNSNMKVCAKNIDNSSFSYTTSAA